MFTPEFTAAAALAGMAFGVYLGTSDILERIVGCLFDHQPEQQDYEVIDCPPTQSDAKPDYPQLLSVAQNQGYVVGYIVTKEQIKKCLEQDDCPEPSKDVTPEHPDSSSPDSEHETKCNSEHDESWVNASELH